MKSNGELILEKIRRKNNWKEDRIFYQVDDSIKLQCLYPTKSYYYYELKNNNYIHHLNITAPKLLFAAPSAYIGPTGCSHIYAIIREHQPNLIIESGIGRGATSTFILTALQKNGKGKLISIDKDADAGPLVFNGLKLNWDKRIGKTSDILPTIDTSIDIFLHDSLHTYHNMLFEFEWAYQHMSSGGIIMSHDIGTNNSLYDFARKYNKVVQYLPTTKNRYGVGVIVK